MMAITSAISPDVMTRMIGDEIRRRIDIVIEEEIQAAAKRIDSRMRAELDKIALSVLSRYSVEQNRDELIIRVVKPEARVAP